MNLIIHLKTNLSNKEKQKSSARLKLQSKKKVKRNLMIKEMKQYNLVNKL